MKKINLPKLDQDFIKNQYRSGVDSYADFSREVGLWDSEQYVFQKYLQKTDNILDLGCGTGRTTFPLRLTGFQHIIGVDLTPEMIDKARELNTYFGTQINFEVGDAMNLQYADSSFDGVIFSFNGFMSIPKISNRKKALDEISRVLRLSGVFIFTTHDREKEEQFFEFWEEEKERWKLGNQNPLLFDYGDLLTSSKNESREIYIHIPDQKEILDLLSQHDFELIETFYRGDKFEERAEVKSKSGECRFWVARKTKNSARKKSNE